MLLSRRGNIHHNISTCFHIYVYQLGDIHRRHCKRFHLAWNLATGDSSVIHRGSHLTHIHQYRRNLSNSWFMLRGLSGLSASYQWCPGRSNGEPVGWPWWFTRDSHVIHAWFVYNKHSKLPSGISYSYAMYLDTQQLSCYNIQLVIVVTWAGLFGRMPVIHGWFTRDSCSACFLYLTKLQWNICDEIWSS